MTRWTARLEQTRTLVPQIVLRSDGGHVKTAELSELELARIVADGATALERLAHAHQLDRLRRQAAEP